MGRHHRRPTGWRKSSNKDEARLGELTRRVLTDMDDCRLAWQKNADPLALMIGVIKSEHAGAVPQWLADALLVALYPGLYRKESEARDGMRASGALAARTEADAPRTLSQAYIEGGKRAHELAGTPAVGEDAIKAAVRRVSHGLKNEGAYWQAEPGWCERLKLAFERRAGRLP